MFEILSHKSFSVDKSTKVGILISVNTSLVIYKLCNDCYELFQSIPFATMDSLKLYNSMLAIDSLTISKNSDEIKLTLTDDGTHGGIMRKITILYKKQGTMYSLEKI